MRRVILKRGLIAAVILIVCYLLQCTLFPRLTLASVKPNLLLIVVASYGLMRGTRYGMIMGFFAGLLVDIQFGNFLGFYALIYLMFGYVNGLFEQYYFSEGIQLPLILVAASEFVYGLLIYLMMFLLRSEFNFLYYLQHIIIPELIYTSLITLVLYPLLHWVNHRLDIEEKGV